MLPKFAKFLLLFSFFFFGLANCQQPQPPALGSRVKITTECAQEQITLHIQFNENMLPGKRFTDWIIVGTTMRPECRLRGNGELRYIVQIAVLKDPCATKMLAPDVFQNTLRISAFPGLILSDDLNFEFKCVYGMPEVLELRLPQANRERAGASDGMPMRGLSPIVPSSSTSSSSSNFLLSGGIGQSFMPQNGDFGMERVGTNNNNKNGGGAAIFDGLEQPKRTTAQMPDLEKTINGQRREDNNNNNNNNNELVTTNDDFDVSNQWEERRNSISSNVVVAMAGLLGLFLLGCVFMAFFYSVKQYRATRRSSPFAHLDSRTSPGHSSLSPGSDEEREHRATEWRNSDTNSTAVMSNQTVNADGGGAGGGVRSYHNEELNLEPVEPIPPVPSHNGGCRPYNKGIELPANSLKAFGTDENGQLVRPKLRKQLRHGLNEQEGGAGTAATGGRSDNDALREDFNAAACRSITEIYKSAEMKLKGMMIMQQAEVGTNPESEYSTPKKLQMGKESENLLINCVNKIRGYGTRKLTEQEMLRWRQLNRNDANFQNRVFNASSEEELLQLCDLPQYRVLFTKMKWAQIMGCIAEELFDEHQEEAGAGEQQHWHNNNNDNTVRRVKPLSALPKCKIMPTVNNKPSNRNANGSLKIFVGNGGE